MAEESDRPVLLECFSEMSEDSKDIYDFYDLSRAGTMLSPTLPARPRTS